MTKYFNSTAGPFRIDGYGRIVGGQEWFESKSTPEIRNGISNGDIVVIEEEENSADEAKSAGKK